MTSRLRTLSDPAHLPALRPHAAQLVDRYSERKDRAEPVATPVETAGL